MMRYRFYRVHKLVCHEMAEFDRLAAKTDFEDNQACQQLAEKLAGLITFLEHHAMYEDACIHDLLRQKDSHVHDNIEQEHKSQEQIFADLTERLKQIESLTDTNARILHGNEFYLAYRLFYSEMLKHLYDEEKVILPELQRLYSDDELAALQAKTYAKMTAEQMNGMLMALFPHGNSDDIRFFIAEMKKAEPEKFAEMLTMISPELRQFIEVNDENINV